MSAQRAEQLFKIGAEQQARGAVAAAERTYERALAADPTHYGANHNLGDLQLRTGRLAQGVEAYRRALAARPSETELRRKLAAILVAFGRGAEAVADAERVAAEDDSAVSRMLLARALLAAGRTSDACREMVRALAFNSRNSEVQLDVALCFIAAEDFDAALMHANAVRLRDPRNAAAVEIVGSIRSQQRVERWGWLPIVVALAVLFAAIGARGRDRRPPRWAAVGVLVAAIAWVGWLADGSRLWIAGGAAVALYPFYAAVRFRRRARPVPGDARGPVVTATGTMLACVARCDGVASAPALRAARESCEALGLAGDELLVAGSAMQQCMADVQAALVEHEAIYARLHAACAELAGRVDDATRISLFRSAVRVALSNGRPTPKTIGVVTACGGDLKIPAAVQEAAWREAARQEVTELTSLPAAADSPPPPEAHA